MAQERFHIAFDSFFPTKQLAILAACLFVLTPSSQALVLNVLNPSSNFPQNSKPFGMNWTAFNIDIIM